VSHLHQKKALSFLSLLGSRFFYLSRLKQVSKDTNTKGLLPGLFPPRFLTLSQHCPSNSSGQCNLSTSYLGNHSTMHATRPGMRSLFFLSPFCSLQMRGSALKGATPHPSALSARMLGCRPPCNPLVIATPSIISAPNSAGIGLPASSHSVCRHPGPWSRT